MPNEISANPTKDDPALKTKPPEDQPDGQQRPGGGQSGAPAGGGPIRNMHDVISSSLEQSHGAGGGGEHAPLAEKLLAPPSGNYHWTLQDLTVKANLAEGRASVTNMSYTVSDGNGGTRQISGPSSYNPRGQQFIVDLETKERFKITPPTDGQPAQLTPVGRGHTGDPLPIIKQNAVDGFTRPPATAGGDGQPVVKAQPGADGQPVKPQGGGDGQPVKPQQVPAGADGQPLKPQQPPAGADGQPFKPQQPPVGADGQPFKPQQPVATARGDIGAGLQPAAPLANPRGDAQGLGQGQGQGRGDGNPLRGLQPTDASQVPGKGVGMPPQPGDTGFRAQPPLPPQQLDAIRAQLQLQQNPQAMADALARMQQIQQGLGQGQIIQLPQLGDRGKLQPNAQQQLSPQDLQALQMQQLGKLQQNPLQQMQPLDPALRNVLADKNNQPALQLLLADLRGGKLPSEAVLQANKPLNDIIRAIGPEGLADLRRVIMSSQDATMAGGRPLDVSALNPRSLQIMDLIASQLGKPQAPGDQLRTLQQNPSALVSERLLEIFKQAELKPGMRLPDADLSRANILELGKVIAQMNAQNLDGRQLAMKDILSRSLEPAALDRREFAMKLDVLRPEQRNEQRVELRTEARVLEPKVAERIERQERTERVEATRAAESQFDPYAAKDQRDLAGKRDLSMPFDKDDKRLDELATKELKPVKKQDELHPQQQQIDQAALAAALAAKNRKQQLDEKDKQEQAQEKDKKEAERRQKYIVRPGDTLESIATRMLRDKQLAGLIYEINKDLIPVVVVDHKKVPQLQERSVIWLPTPTEAKDYRRRLLANPGGTATTTQYASAEDELEARFGKNWGAPGATAGGGALEDLEDTARVAYASRRKHIESLLGPLSPKSDTSQPKYVVRLGETLKSVAMKHPALQDVSLWKLLAELNGLSSEADDKGNPVAKLSRGQSIILPSAAEIEAFRQRGSHGGSKTKISGVLELPTRICQGCKRQTFASASLCPGCGRQFEDRPTATTAGAATRPQPTIKSPSKPPAAPAPAASLPKPAPTIKAPEPKTTIADAQVASSPSQSGFTFKKQFSETARSMTAGTPTELDSGFKLRLETLVNGEWQPIVMYEIFTGTCLRHEVSADGQSKTIRIDLPPQAAIELASNDIETNWQAYEFRIRSASQV